MKAEDRVVGLTTAASLWLTAAIGLAIGLGLYTTATIATIFGTLVLLLKPVEDYILKSCKKIWVLVNSQRSCSSLARR